MTLDDLLASTGDVTPVDTATLSVRRDAVLAAAREDVTSRARIVRHRRRRRVAYVAAVAAVACIAWVAQPGSGPISEREALPVPPVVEAQFTDASQIVTAAADAAGQQPGGLGDAPYWKVVSEYSQGGSERPEENREGRRTIWQGIAGPSVLRDTDGGGFTLEEGKPLELPQATLTVGGRTFTWREINAGALGAAQVRELLTAGESGMSGKAGRAPHEWYFFKQAGELLGETPASPAVRRAIWNEMSTLTGVTTTGKVTDAIGRTGWDLTIAAEGFGSQRFVVDPSTGAILQSETAGRGTTYRITYIEAGPAETAPRPVPESEMPVEAGR